MNLCILIKEKPIPFTKFLDQFSSKETKQVVRASFLPFIGAQEDLKSSGANRVKPTPPNVIFWIN